MLKQKPACSRHQSYVRQISAVHVATNRLTLPWPNHRPLLPKTPAMTLSKNPHPQEAARLPTRRLGEKRKSINVWINSRTRVEKILASPLLLVLTVGLGKTCFRSRASTITRKSTTRGTALSPEKTCQKTSIGLSNLYSND